MTASGRPSPKGWRPVAAKATVAPTTRHQALPWSLGLGRRKISGAESIAGLTNRLTHNVDQILWCLWVGIWAVEHRQLERHHDLLLETKELLWVGRLDQNGSEVLLRPLPWTRPRHIVRPVARLVSAARLL